MTLNPLYTIKTTIVVNKPANSTQYSGNPGYMMGKPITIQNAGSAFTLYNIADTSGNCIAASSAGGVGSTTTSVLFGQNIAYSCISTNPCSSSLYIDSLIKLTGLKIQKWAKGSTDSISVSGTGTSTNSCNFQTIVLNILYSSAGW